MKLSSFYDLDNINALRIFGGEETNKMEHVIFCQWPWLRKLQGFYFYLIIRPASVIYIYI